MCVCVCMCICVCVCEDYLQLGKLKENCLLRKLYCKFRNNVSDPHTGIEPETF